MATKVLVRCASLLIAFLIAACGPSLRPGPEVALEANKGLVILILDPQGMFRSEPGWIPTGDGLAIQSVDDPTQFQSLKQVSSKVSGTWVYAAALPPGTYELSSYGASRVSYPTTEVRTYPLDRLGTFRVEAGRVTYLGSVIPLPGKLWQRHFLSSSRPFTVGVHAEPADLITIMQTMYPAIHAMTAGQSALGWIDSPDHAEAESAYAEVRKQLGDACTVATDTGVANVDDVVVSGILGQVDIRSSGGGCRRLQIPTTMTITQAYKLADGRILAASPSGGLVWLWSGSEWSLVQISGHFEDRPLSLGYVEGLGYYVALSDSDNLHFYRARQPAGPWEAFGEFKQEWGWLNPDYYPFNAVREASHGLIAQLNPNRLLTYDAASGSWQDKKAPANFRQLTALTDGSIVVSALRQVGHTEEMAYLRTSDRGATWEMSGTLPLDDNTLAHGPVVLRDGTWLVQLSPKVPEFLESRAKKRIRRFFEGEPVRKIVVSHDQGQSWTDATPFRTGDPAALISFRRGYWSVHERAAGGLLYSRNEGKDWAVLIPEQELATDNPWADLVDTR